MSLFYVIVVTGHPTEYYRAQLGAFGLSGDIVLRPVVALSGGQKSRVAFTLMSMQKLVMASSRVGLNCWFASASFKRPLLSVNVSVCDSVRNFGSKYLRNEAR